MRLDDLDTLIPSYAANKEEQDNYKKLCDKENAKIKEIMMGFVVKEYRAGGYKARCSVTTKETFDENLLMDIIKEHNIPGVIKTKEYIDFDALENVIYNGLEKSILLEMDKAKESKEIITLRVTKDTKKEEED